MEKYAFKMKLNPGMEAEYKRRHDEIWPELSALLKEAGVSAVYHPGTSREDIVVGLSELIGQARTMGKGTTDE